MDPSQFSEARVAEMTNGVVKYLQEERALYLQASEPLSANLRTAVQSYFPKSLLDIVRTVTLEGARIPPPPFYAEAVAMSSSPFPDFVHIASVTYVDIIVFNGTIGPRTLFHGLVHAQQMAFLGLESYVGFYVRGFLQTRSWVNIPLEAQAFKLEERFSMSPPEAFSVEEEVKLWAGQGRYCAGSA
ncbi:MAG TPA: hypothetical protein VFN26_22620 [Candidatus Acidoferrum sp.]|nr:hypothetical protein [Candidatus Acidoferrum sp.]